MNLQDHLNLTIIAHFMRQHREATFRPDGLLRFRLPAREGFLLEQIQNVLQQLHA